MRVSEVCVFLWTGLQAAISNGSALVHNAHRRATLVRPAIRMIRGFVGAIFTPHLLHILVRNRCQYEISTERKRPDNFSFVGLKTVQKLWHPPEHVEQTDGRKNRDPRDAENGERDDCKNGE